MTVPNQRIVQRAGPAFSEEVMARANEWWQHAPETAKHPGNALTRCGDGFLFVCPQNLPMEVVMSLKDGWERVFPDVPFLIFANTEYLHEGRSDQGDGGDTAHDDSGDPGSAGGRPLGAARVAGEGEAPGGPGPEPEGGQESRPAKTRQPRAKRGVRGDVSDLGGGADTSGAGEGVSAAQVEVDQEAATAQE